MTNKKILVAYFSCTGTTKKLANKLADELNADIFQIEPVTEYTKADLDWTNKKSRSSIEMNDMSYRPEITKKLNNAEDYDIIFLGFPIWWYVAPTIINTFLESYDFSNKNIVLFATSGGSGFGKTAQLLQKSCHSATRIRESNIINSMPSKEELDELLK